MNLKTNGMVLKQRNRLDEQKYLVLLTPDRGLIDAKMRVGGQITQSVFRNVNVLGYYRFDLFDGRFGRTVDSAEPIEQFFGLRYSPKKLALAQYFCELTCVLVPSKQKASKHLSLLLNSIWLLEYGSFAVDFLKCVFEFRLLSISGYMPDLVCCKFCFNYEKEKMFYEPYNCHLVCSDCLNCKKVADAIELPNSVLYAMRYIIYKDAKQIFNFKLPNEQVKFLANLVENCVLILVEKELVTLKIYKQFENGFF